MARGKARLSKVDGSIVSKILYLRGEKVMLDRDLAELYNVETRALNQAVKRNEDRFPSKFMFQLSKDEVEQLVSQNVIPSKSYLGGYKPNAFTEHGVLMLANVLKSKRAIEMSIRIIDVFVRMREMLFAHKDIMIKLEKMEKEMSDNRADIQTIFKYLKELLNPQIEPRVKIGFKQRQNKLTTRQKSKLLIT